MPITTKTGPKSFIKRLLLFWIVKTCLLMSAQK